MRLMLNGLLLSIPVLLTFASLSILARVTSSPSSLFQGQDKASKESPEELVLQLGAAQFSQREAAEKRLRALGRKALPALRQAKRDKDLEIARRATKLSEEISRVGIFEHKSWERYKRIAGDTEASRKFFSAMVQDDTYQDVLEKAEMNPKKAGELYVNEINRLYQHYNTLEQFPVPLNATMFLLGSFPETAYVAVEGRKQRSILLWLSFAEGAEGEYREPFAKLFVAWFATRKQTDVLEQALHAAVVSRVKECLPLVRKLAADATLDPKNRAIAALFLGLEGDTGDAQLLMPYRHESAIYEGSIQVGDVILAMILELHRQDPSNFGFEMDGLTWIHQKHKEGYWTPKAFPDEVSRKKAHDRADAWLQQNGKLSTSAPSPKLK